MHSNENIWTTVPENKVKPQYASPARQQWVFVDDDEDDKLIFELAINELKIECDLHCATTGDNMFELLNHTTPDLIFLDLHLPGKSGISCLKMLRYQQVYDHVPIIIYSKNNKPSVINDCYAAKANYFMIKRLTVPKICKDLNKVVMMNWEAERYPSKEDFLIGIEPESKSKEF
jgi:CheY-like chemotaxis protein